MNSTPFPVFAIGINALLLGLTLIVLAYNIMAGKKVYHLFRMAEKPLFFSNLCITLSCVAYIVNCGLYIGYFYQSYEEVKGSEKL